jgi:hypothetical protein
VRLPSVVVDVYGLSVLAGEASGSSVVERYTSGLWEYETMRRI